MVSHYLSIKKARLYTLTLQDAVFKTENKSPQSLTLFT